MRSDVVTDQLELPGRNPCKEEGERKGGGGGSPGGTKPAPEVYSEELAEDKGLDVRNHTQ